MDEPTLTASPDLSSESAIDAQLAERVDAIDATPEPKIAHESATAEEPAPQQDAEADDAEKPPAEPEKQDGEEDDDGEIKADGKSDDGKKFWFTKAKTARLLQANEAWGKVLDKIPDATVESIEQNRDLAVGRKVLESDLRSGNPNLIANVAAYFHQLSPGGLATFAGVLASDWMAKLNPQAYQTLEKAFSEKLGPRMEGDAQPKTAAQLRQWAGEQAADSLEAKALAYAADMIEYKRTQAAPKADPNDAKLAELRRRQDEINQYENRRALDDWTAWQRETGNAVESAVENKIEAKIKSKIDSAKDPLSFKGARVELRNAIDAAFNSNAALKQQVETLYQDAQYARSAMDREQFRKALVNLRSQLADRVIGSQWAKILGQASASAQRESEARNDRLKKAASQKGLTNGQGGAPPQSIASKRIKPGMSDEDLTAVLTEVMEQAV